MIEAEINGARYRSTSKLNALDQFYVAKRLTPILGTIADLAKNPTGDIMASVDRIAGAIGAIPDDDCNYIFGKCLGTVQREQSAGVWSAVWNKAANMPMFEDIDMVVLLRLTITVIQDNLGAFLVAPSPV